MTRLWLLLYVPFALVVLAVSVVAFVPLSAFTRPLKRAPQAYGQAIRQVASAFFWRGVDMWRGQ